MNDPGDQRGSRRELAGGEPRSKMDVPDPEPIPTGASESGTSKKRSPRRTPDRAHLFPFLAGDLLTHGWSENQKWRFVKKIDPRSYGVVVVGPRWDRPGRVIVGIHVHPVERLISTLIGAAYSKYGPFTFELNLADVPGSTFPSSFELTQLRETRSLAQAVARDVHSVGWPMLCELADHQALRRSLLQWSAAQAPRDHHPTMRLIALALLGQDVTEAQAVLDDAERRWRATGAEFGLVWEWFAESVRAWINEHA